MHHGCSCKIYVFYGRGSFIPGLYLCMCLLPVCWYWPIEAEWRIYVSVNYIIIGSDNGLSPGQCQAIIWTNAGILSNRPSGTNFSEILIEIHTFSFKNICIWKCRLENGSHFVSSSMYQCDCLCSHHISSTTQRQATMRDMDIESRKSRAVLQDCWLLNIHCSVC